MVIVAQHGYDAKGRLLTVFLSNDQAGQFAPLSALSMARHNGYLQVRLDRPKKSRSTGWKSQNHHLWGHASQIGTELGYDRREMLYIIAEMTNSWPMMRYKDKTVPVSESGISVDVASEAIETAHRIAAENGITLREGDE